MKCARPPEGVGVLLLHGTRIIYNWLRIVRSWYRCFVFEQSVDLVSGFEGVERQTQAPLSIARDESVGGEAVTGSDWDSDPYS